MAPEPDVGRREALKLIAAGVAVPSGVVTTGTRQVSATEASTVWATEGGDSRHTGVGDAGPAAVTGRWRYREIGDAAPAVLDDLVVFDDDRSSTLGDTDVLVGADPVTGTEVFTVPEVRSFDAPAVANGLAVTGDGPLVAVDTDFGTIRWETSDVAKPTASPTIRDGAVFVPTRDPTELVSVLLDNGAVQWRSSVPATSFRSVAVTSDTAFVATDDGSVGAYATSDGSRRWQQTIGSNQPVRPTVVNDVVYTGAGDTVVALDATDGSVRWQTTLDTLDSKGFAVDNSTVYLCIDAGEFGGAPDDVVALDAGTGDVVWTTQLDATLSAPPTTADGTVYVGGSDTLFLLDAADGSVTDSSFTDDETSAVIPSGPAVSGGSVTVRNGDLFVYEPDRAGVGAATGTPTSVTATTATVTGEVTQLGSTDSAEVFVEHYGGARRTNRTNVASTGTVEVTLDNLRTDRTNDYRFVVAGNNGTTAVGEWRTLTTDPADGEVVTVTSGLLASVTDTTATFEGTVVNNDGVDSVDIGFEYGPAGGSLTNYVDAGSISTAVTFDASVSGLQPGTSYEFRAVGEGVTDADTGSVLSFTTPERSTAAPAVDQFTVSSRQNKQQTRASADWAVSDDDGDLQTVRVALVASDGTTTAADETSVSGATASGTTDLKSKNGGSLVRLSVTDSEGTTTTADREI